MNEFYVYILRRQDLPDPHYVWKECPFYVGKGKGNRLNHHRQEAIRKLKSGKKFIKDNIIHSLWSDGLDFREEIIKNNLTEDEAFYWENKMILFYGRMKNNTGCLANLTDGGEGPCGLVHSKETRTRMSEAQSKERNHFFGKKHTVETRKKISDNHYRGPRSEETKRKISVAMNGENNPFYGKKHSEESIEKMRQSSIGQIPWNKGMPRTEECKEKIRQTKRNNRINI